jgi:GNAT superfamily N-acetyltransferase
MVALYSAGERRICSVPAVKPVQVTTWFLQMTDPGQLAAAPEPDPELEMRQAEIASPEVSRALYAGVGSDWYWTDRLSWSWRRWHEWLARPELEVWLPQVRGTPAGYVELERDGDAVELVAFGLLPSFIGRGIGTRALDFALRRAWAQAPRRVWVHTCSLDGPAALRTYRGRGLEVYDERIEQVVLPSERLEPWPGADRPAP